MNMPPFSESDISIDLSVRAFALTSHSPERRGASVRSGYVASLTDAWRCAVEVAGDDPDAIARIAAEFENLRDGYLKRVQAYLRAHSNVASSMIVGPAKFPVDRNRKRGDTADKRAADADDFIKKGIARLLKAARAPIDDSPSGEVESIMARLVEREKKQEFMKAANLALRRCDDDKLRAIGYTDTEIAAMKKPDFAGRAGFPSYALANNNAEILRLKGRLAKAESRVDRAAAGPAGRMVGDVRVVEDADADRLQLFFGGKPDGAKRAVLKQNGFRWAPSVGAWQRQLTNNARSAAQHVLA